MKQIFLTAMLSFVTATIPGGTTQAVVVLSEDFEIPDVDSSQSDSFTSGAVPAGWIGATQGFGANRRGVVDESHGDFTDPVGQQAFAFRYTNSGLTSDVGQIGTLKAGETYDVSFDVVRDDHNGGLPWRVKLVAFDDGASRNDVRNNNGSTVLYEDNDDAMDNGLYSTISFSFTPDEGADAPLFGKDLALRFLGATTSATIDNVVVEVTPPGPDFFLKLQVDTVTGQSTLVGRPTVDVGINYYQITSENDSLTTSGWQTLDSVDYGGDNWIAAGGSGPHSLAEGLTEGSSTITAGSTVSLGTAYDTTRNAQDLQFLYQNAQNQIVEGIVEYITPSIVGGDYNGDGQVDLADYTLWRNNLGEPESVLPGGSTDGSGTIDAGDYALWRSNFGTGAGNSVASNAVPEPSTIILLGLTGLLILSPRHYSAIQKGAV